jgi:predicted dehydrogenase
MYQAAILGCGPRAIGHAEAYAHVLSGRLVAACDLDGERLRKYCDRFRIEARFTDLREMLETVRPDLLHVVTIPERLAVIQVALQAPPRALLVEKPLACRPSVGYAILDSCREAGVPLYVNHQLRHHAPFQRVRDAILGEEIGTLVSLRGSSKGQLLEQGTHLLDLLSFVQDDVPAQSVLAAAEGAAAFQKPHASPDNTLMAFRWRGGVPVLLESGAASPTWRDETNFWLNKGIEAVGTRGSVGSSSNHGWWIVTDRGRFGEERSYEEEDVLAQARLIEGIFHCFHDPTYQHPNRPEVSPIAFNLAQAAMQSALERRRISLPAPRVPDAVFDGLREALERAAA